MARIESEAARCQAVMQQLKTFPVIDFDYRLELIGTDDGKYQIICFYIDSEGALHHTVEPAEAIGDTPEEALEGWNRLIDEKGRV